MPTPRPATLLHADPATGSDVERARGVSPLDDLDRERLAEPIDEDGGWQLTLPGGGVVAVLVLYDQLPLLAWAFAAAVPGARLGYVQTAGVAPPDGHREMLGALRASGLLVDHLLAGAASGDDGETLSVAGALHHGLRDLGWEAAVCGPRAPDLQDAVTGTVDHDSPGQVGLAALDTAHTALALGCRTLLVPRMSTGEPDEPGEPGEPGARQRGISPDTLTVLDLLLQPVTVALPAGLRSPVGADLRAGLGAIFGASRGAPVQLELDVARPARIARHDWRRAPIDLPGFVASGLPAPPAGRGPLENPLGYGTALAAGGTLAELVAESRDRRLAEDGEGAAA